jgi:uncharacterized protein YkwD
MSGGSSSACLTRRSLFGAAILMAGMASARASAAPVRSPSPSSWLDYEARLRARLADAGGGRFDPDFARSLLSQANTFRAGEGLAAYAWDDGLAACARAHAADMANRNYFAHETPEGFTHLERTSLLTRDLCGDTAENLAWREAQRGGTTPRQFEQLWEASPGHRKNLLRERYTSAGYGVVKVNNAYYAAGVYADASVRLARPLPLRVHSGADLSPALSGASPSIERLTLTRPFQDPTWIASTADRMPSLQPGVWQLRPMRFAGGNRFDVLTGPLFFVA